ncbi:MAG TPA: oligosaccharide flippase family protein, partial [Paracoccus sp. (in: a-proteobacteria)]|nr:oligosaccharide flippase family protein [Paracoccus sp. (in: a-proteobacteria)]
MKNDQRKSLRAALLRNLSWTFSAQILVSLVAVATLFITARALGAAGLGILALVESYVRLVDLLLRLEPWQAVIRYGVRIQESGDRGAFARLIKLSILVDAAGGLLAGLVCMGLAGLAAPLVGLPPGTGPHYVYLVAAGLFFSFRPTATAVLRIFDRFDLLARVDVAAALIRLALSAAAWWAGLGLWAFLAILLVQGLLDGLAAFALAMRLLRRKGVGGVIAADWRTALAENPGFLRFLWNSNVNVILRQSVNRLDVLAVGALLDLRAVGFYQLGKRVMNRANKLAAPLRQVVFPELSRLWTRGKFGRFNRLVLMMCLSILSVQLLIALPFLWHMEAVVRILFGPDYAGAGPVMSILLISSIVFASGVILNPALLAMGKDGLLVRATTLSTVVFAASFVPLVRRYGIEGAAMANLFF